MFCNNCGKEISENSKFCNFCGNETIVRKKIKDKEATKQVRVESAEDYIWTCDYCKKEFDTKSESDSHEETCGLNPKNTNEKVKIFCAKCGVENLVEAKFCKKCGNDMSTEQLNYAGFWVRFGAWLIDYAGILLLTVIIAIGMAVFFGFDTTNIDSGTDWLISVGSMILYFTFFPAIWSTTPGKRIYGLTLLKETGEKLDWGTSLKRAIIQPFSCFLFGIGYNNMNKNGKEQAWHDRKSHTLVLRKEGINYFFPIVLSILGFVIYAWVRSLSSST